MKKYKELEKILLEQVNRVLKNKHGIVASLDQANRAVCFQRNVTAGQIIGLVYKILEQNKLLEVFLLYLASEKLKK